MIPITGGGLSSRFVAFLFTDHWPLIIDYSSGVIDLTENRVGAMLMPTASSRAERSPDREESACFLALADQVPERFRWQVLLTAGGHPASHELMRRARTRGIAVVFHLHNLGFNDQWATEHARTPAVENRKPDATTRSPGLLRSHHFSLDIGLRLVSNASSGEPGEVGN